MRKSFLPLLVCISMLGTRATGQDNQSGPASASFLPDPYYRSFNVSLPVYNGRVFDPYASDIKGYALIPEVRWAAITVLYDGIWYNVTGRYDCHADQLILRNPDSTCLFVPNRDRVSQFMMDGRTFLKMDSGINASFKGYYEMIADGPLTVYAKRGMLLHEDISGTVVEREFIPENFYYIRKNAKFYPVRTKSNLFALIPEKKNQVQKELKNQQIKFRRDPEAAILIAAGLYK